jgi:type III secretory pathway component EscU
MADSKEAISKKLDPEPQPNPVRVMSALIGGVLGGAAVFFLQSGHLNLKPATMTFEQFAGILLTAVAVIVAVFGAGLAILAFWGFRQLKQASIEASVKMAKDQVDEIIRQEISSPEMEQRIRNRVDEILLGSEKDKELDEDPENLGGNGAE